MSDETASALTRALDRLGDGLATAFGLDATVIPVVRLHGTIANETRPNRINIDGVNPLLEKAFKMRRAPAVAIIINSPGGSAVQSRLVSKRIRDLAIEHNKQVLVFVEDVAASGGYFIAVAGNEIYADPSSVVGSIGVIMGMFGFDQAIEKLGISRRVYTAGSQKNLADPFLPENADDVELIKEFETDIHEVFIDWVKSHRGQRLNGSDEELFTGRFWTAKRGLELGLIDGLGDVYSVLREKFGDKLRLKKIERRRGLFPVLPFGMGAATRSEGLAADIASELQSRALWGRFGL